MDAEKPIELQERRCPVCNMVLEIAWGRVKRMFYWYHPQDMKLTQQCKMRGRSRRWEDRRDAMTATEIWKHDETTPDQNRQA